jgi:hypothetical protein
MNGLIYLIGLIVVILHSVLRGSSLMATASRG